MHRDDWHNVASVGWPSSSETKAFFLLLWDCEFESYLVVAGSKSVSDSIVSDAYYIHDNITTSPRQYHLTSQLAIYISKYYYLQQWRLNKGGGLPLW